MYKLKDKVEISRKRLMFIRPFVCQRIMDGNRYCIVDDKDGVIVGEGDCFDGAWIDAENNITKEEAGRYFELLKYMND